MNNKEQQFFTNKWNVVLFAVICNVLWGSAFPAIKSGMQLFAINGSDTYTKILFAGVRFFFAGLIILVVGSVRARRVLLPNKKTTGGLILLALVQTTVQYIFFYIGLSNTTGTLGSILDSTTSFWVVMLGPLFFASEKITAPKLLGCVLGFAGVVIAVGGNLNTGFSFLGEGFMLLAALSFSVGSLISKRVSQYCESATVAGYNLLLGAVLLIAIGLIGGGRFTQVSGTGIAVLAYLILLSSAAFTINTLLLQYNSAGKICIYNFLIPVVGTLLSVLILKEQAFQFKFIGALVLVCLGIYIVNKPTKTLE
ncbi:MAG: DMT family transporter [Oscillospiraceae bacterium]|nr:DMT family transporter [Oscillospiraceae bacterium]